MIGPSSAFFPFIGPPGLFISVDAGDVLSAGVVTRVPLTQIALSPSATNYVFLTVSTFTITKNTTGFPTTDAFPIAIATTDSQKVLTLADERSDVTSVASGSAILLQTNGVNNVSQAKLNLIGSVTDNGVGGVTIAGTAVQVNGTPTSSQTPINFTSASFSNNDGHMAITNPSAGNVSINFGATIAATRWSAFAYFRDSDILALNTIPITIATVSSAHVIIPIAVQYLWIFGGTATFTNTHANDLIVYTTLGGVAAPFFTGSSTGLLNTSNTQAVQIPSTTSSTRTFNYTSGDSVFIKNNSTAYTGGDSGGNSNQLGVIVTYLVMDPVGAVIF